MTTPNALHVLDLRADYLVEPLGMEVRHPRLSWRLESEGRGVMQASYRIRASADADGETLLWDSGVVDSDACFDITYGAPPLQSMQRIWWDVEISDNRGRRARSERSWFEGGLIAPEDWRASWIEAEDEGAAADRAAGLQWIWSADPLDPRLHGFRLDFDAPADLIDAEILIAAKDNLLGVWLNGEPAALPDLVYWGTLLPTEGQVRPGRNSLCLLASADTSGFFPVDGGAMAALIRLNRGNGDIERLVSGPQWRVKTDPPEDWTTADYDAADWDAAQASGSHAQGDPRPKEPAIRLRTEFDARGPVVEARLYATALGTYAARINGQPVSNHVLAPEISVAKSHILYQCHDVTPLLQEGLNALAFTVADGFYAGAFGWRMERYGFGPAPRRLLAQLRIDYADGSSDWVKTGSDWRIGGSPILESDIYGGETYDARQEQPGWDLPGFDDSAWRTVRIGATPPAQLIAQTAPPLRATRTMRALSVTEPAPGRFVFDFGQNMPGWVKLYAKGQAGRCITLRFAELLNPDGTADQSNLRRAACTDHVILRGDAAGETFAPQFTYHGFRYVEVEGYPGTPTLDDIEGIVVHSDCRETGTMDFASPLLQRIWDNALWSQRSNFFAVPTDCPQRDERMGWMGDIQVFLDAAAFNMEVDPFIRRFLLEARAAQRPDGAYPIVVPQPLSFPDVVTAGWSEAGIILPHGLWQRYGDTAVIDENWDAMEGWMAFVARDNPDHIWRNDRGLDLGDWLSVDAIQPDDETTPRILCATAYWAYSAQLMADMARATGRDGDAARYEALRAEIGKAFAAELIDGDGKAGNGSQCSQVLALYMGLVPQGQRAAAAHLLAQDIRDRGMTLSTGFLGTPYLLDVLAKAGAWEEVVGLLLQTAYPSWGYMPSVGATTVWERWNGDVGDLSMNSYNHYAFGAVVGFFYRRLAGIAPAAPGFRRVDIKPLWFKEAGDVSARYEAITGLIATKVEGDAAGLSSLTVTIPANCTALVELPAGQWTEAGHRVEGHPDFSVSRPHADIVHIEIGSGDYHFIRA
ncbi:family 78 glycoside hydrolase catalytic domain [Sphingobium sp. CR2-8]|uniref:alpha-L-rhamnosidase n=1 Tax=Sphingobium sp. CR2-8 TaxID=1306534 RepID=UPI002DBB385E|nr:family 78 glycoside hydrolase catalytic domain [Sphingobium sp. CR2-8]MEC3909365.1 family 78 glycoside hydrolase catalytic domain [Sphingobium sp. CR2-8]